MVLPTVELIAPSSDWRPPSKGSRTGPLDLIAQRRTLPHLLLYHAWARVHLREGRVTYRDYASHKEMAATLAEVHATTTDAGAAAESGGCGAACQHAAAVHPVRRYTPRPQRQQAIPLLQVHLVTPPWQVDLHGTIAQPLQLQGVAAEVSLTRWASAQPSDHHGQAAPSQEPSKLAGHLTQEGDVWAVRGLAGTLGTSDLRGGHLRGEAGAAALGAGSAFLAPLGCA